MKEKRTSFGLIKSKAAVKILFLTSFGLNLIAFWIFSTENFLKDPPIGTISGLFWIASIVCLALGCYLLQNNHKEKSKPSLSKKEISLLLIIIFVSIALRLYKIDHLGVFLDDWYWLDHARAIQAGQITTPFGFIGDQPSNMPAFVVYIFYWLFNHTYLAARLTGIFFSTINLILVFFLAKEFFNKRTGFIAIILVATSIWDIYVSKIPWINTTVNPMLITGSLLFFYRALKNHNPKDIFWSGFFIGMSFNLLYIALLEIIVLVAYATRLLLKKDGINQHLPTLIFIGFAAFIVCSPMIPRIMRYPEQSFSRHEAFVEANTEHSAAEGGLGYYFQETAKTVLRFQARPDNYQDNNFPYWGITIEPVVQYMFMIGIVYLFITIRKGPSALILLTFLAMSIPLIILERGISNWREYSYFTPLYLTAALGVNSLILIFEKLIKKKRLTAAYMLVLLVIYLASWLYFFDIYYKNNVAKNNFVYEATCQEATLFILENAPKGSYILVPNEMCRELMSIRIWDDYKFTVYDSLDEIDHLLSNQKQSALVLLPVSGFSSPFRQTLDEMQFELFMKDLQMRPVNLERGQQIYLTN